MLTYEDCVGLAGLTEAEIETTVRRQRIPMIVAIGCCLAGKDAGADLIQRIVRDAFEPKLDWQRILADFRATHPMPECEIA